MEAGRHADDVCHLLQAREREGEEIGRDVLAAARRGQIDDGAGAGHRHGFRDRPDLQRHVDPGRETGIHLQALAHQRLESLNLESKLIRATREIDEAVVSLAVGRHRQRLDLQGRTRGGLPYRPSRDEC